MRTVDTCRIGCTVVTICLYNIDRCKRETIRVRLTNWRHAFTYSFAHSLTHSHTNKHFFFFFRPFILYHHSVCDRDDFFVFVYEWVDDTVEMTQRASNTSVCGLLHSMHLLYVVVFVLQCFFFFCFVLLFRHNFAERDAMLGKKRKTNTNRR